MTGVDMTIMCLYSVCLTGAMHFALVPLFDQQREIFTYSRASVPDSFSTSWWLPKHNTTAGPSSGFTISELNYMYTLLSTAERTK